MRTVSLDGKWHMRDIASGKTYDANVPGSVISCLLEHEAIVDPYVGTNEYEVRDYLRNDFSYERSFDLDETLLNEDHIDLICEGIDTIADIYVNDILLVSVDNMFRTWKIPCETLLHAHNVIRIDFHSAIEYMEHIVPAPGKEIHYVPVGGMKGNQYVRKAHSMFGWDWGLQLPDMGIWRAIRLEAYSEVRVEQVRFTQIHETDHVELRTRIFLEHFENHFENPTDIDEYQVQVVITDPDNNVVEDTIHQADALIDSITTIPNPQLWWPNGYGAQPLYKIQIVVSDRKRNRLSEQIYRIGLRTLTVSQDKDEWGEEFAFKVNGIKIFTRGSNYIPEDGIYPNITDERLQTLIDAAVRSNHNCLRIWGGGYYPSDKFYDLCDEAGLIIWQDLMYACNAYDLTPEFEASIVAETTDNVRRLRHHASLGLWCGNNEIESAWDGWADFQGETPYIRADYIKQFEHVLPKALKAEDDQTFFWPSSPSSGGCIDDPSSEDRGDVHYWDVWHGQKPFTDYQKFYFRFCSEFGFQSFPSLKTIATFAEEKDWNIFSEVMESHQKNGAANGKILYYISENFLYPKDFDALLYVSQVLQGLAIKYGVEHWRRHRGRCMGAIYWQLNDNWPVASWASIDYYGRWKALHYMTKNFYAQVAGSILRDGENVAVSVSNEGLTEANVKVLVSLKNTSLEVIDSVGTEYRVAPQSVINVFEKDVSEWIVAPNDKGSVFVEAKFIYEDGRTQVEVEPFVPYKHVQLCKPEIGVTVTDEGDAYRINLTTDTFAPFAEVRFSEIDGILSDNFVMLTEKDGTSVYLQKSDVQLPRVTNIADHANVTDVVPTASLSTEALAAQIQVYSLYDSF
ncbi:MAG: glycoside hydrolase family 2 protein [Clostridiales Family XIII bacterium]|jgi:beta-mannosidase|nr:glycoside hydrolase family 2 protein [Clostridiales Family XIII bacterium]